MKRKNRFEGYFKFLIYTVVIILINLVGLTLFGRIDLTGNKIFSLSQASRKVVSTLSEPLTINVFFTENLPAPHNSTNRYLRDLLEEYAIYGNKHFNYRFYDVSPKEERISERTEENRKLAESYGIYPVQIRMIEQDEMKFKNAYMGMVIIHGDLIEKIPAITSTDGLEYKVTTAIEKLNNKISTLVALPEKVDIKMVMSSSLEKVAPYIGTQDLPSLPGAIEKTVNELNKKNYGKLTYAFIDPDKENNLKELQEKFDIMTLKWPGLPENGIAPGEGGIGMIMSYAGKTRSIQLMNVYRIPIFGTRYELIDKGALEETINKNVETLIGINEDLGYLADHGAPELSNAMPPGMPNQSEQALRNFESLFSQNYTVRPIRLADEPIPDSLNTLVIAQPTEPFTDYELYQIDQALMRGTNLAIFTDAFKEVPNQNNPYGFNMGPSYQPLDTGLQKLLAHYGVQVKPAFVLDKNCYKQQSERGGDQPIYFAPLIKNENINHDVDFLKNIKGMITLNQSPIFVDEEILKKNGVSAEKLLSSSNESWQTKGQINLNPMFITPPENKEEYESQPLAYLLEGTFGSYFKGKPIPEKKADKPADNPEGAAQMPTPDGKTPETASNPAKADLSKFQTENRFQETGRPAKLLVVGSSALLKDNMIDQNGDTPNAAFVLNAIDALNGRGDIAAMRSKAQQYNPLGDSSAMTKGFIKSFNIGGLPIMVVIFGLAVWWARRMKRRRIRMMFAR